MVSTKILLQRVLDDSTQIRTTLQGFSSVLKEMSQVCDIERLQAQLVEADGQVATVQESFTAPLSQLEHAAAVSRPSSDPNIVSLSLLTLIHYCFLMFFIFNLRPCRRWKPLKVKSGGCRVNWMRSRVCCYPQRLYPNPRKKSSRWDHSVFI